MSADGDVIRKILGGASGYIYEHTDDIREALGRLETNLNEATRRGRHHAGCRGDMFAELAGLFDMEVVHPRSIIAETRLLVEMEKRSVARLRLVFYLLMRDDVPSGIVAKRVQEVAEVEKVGVSKFTSEHLAAYAMELAERTLEGTG